MDKEVIKNKYGYYELKLKPDKLDLEKYYSKQYYQLSKGTHSKSYTIVEIEYILNRINRKYSILSSFPMNIQQKPEFLDIGCGEGWALSYFRKKNWSVLGLDYSLYGVKSINPDLLKYLVPGDITENVESLIHEKKKFDVILMDNVLEHLPDPEGFIHKLNQLIQKHGILIIEVPNDFSIIQEYALKKKYIKNRFWIKSPDHISYFNSKGLKNLLSANGWSLLHLSADFPIDINLLNQDTNYITDETKGKPVHIARIEIENILDRISTIKTNQLYHIFAEMELGRNIIGYFCLK